MDTFNPIGMEGRRDSLNNDPNLTWVVSRQCWKIWDRRGGGSVQSR